jgi:hypothetical protein
MKYLAITFPGGLTINPPAGIPQGGLTYLQSVFRNALTIIIIIGIFLTLIYLTWAGAQWITSGGDKAKLAAARSKLTWAIIGISIILLSFFILSIIGYLFKVNLLQFP